MQVDFPNAKGTIELGNITPGSVVCSQHNVDVTAFIVTRVTDLQGDISVVDLKDGSICYWHPKILVRLMDAELKVT